MFIVASIAGLGVYLCFTSPSSGLMHLPQTAHPIHFHAMLVSKADNSDADFSSRQERCRSNPQTAWDHGPNCKGLPSNDPERTKELLKDAESHI